MTSLAPASLRNRGGRVRSLVSGWTAGAAAIALIVAVPVLAVVWLALFPSENVWPHLIETVLPASSHKVVET